MSENQVEKSVKEEAEVQMDITRKWMEDYKVQNGIRYVREHCGFPLTKKVNQLFTWPDMEEIKL